ncbi:protease complex subunit PrcB family protein [Desertibacillus haloalkaliphilus]|uniref:protease complex subunit PrcB family protein n=1 Tax=Desertibacillus haloalkaliphilus TaxID=1328930 RepID=UPI001C2762A6|nr:protease complex subunit PrcB family protein [Desertibacillus haloalkaliphilus]MBU8906608.1 protease complex subunit PrcB family protein [Desertibacillus haloalkaliphilus]
MNDYPQAVIDKLESIKEEGGIERYTDQRHTYIILALGMRPTGGYSIEVTSIREKNDKVVIQAREIAPGPYDFVTQVITYPTKVVKLDRTTLPVLVIWRNGQQEATLV